MIGSRQKFKDHLDSWDILDRLLLFLYAAGSYLPESKILRIAIADSQKFFPRFLPLTFDGRFFGPLSSDVEKAINRGYKLGFIQEGYYTRGNEPIHLERKLTIDGDLSAKNLVKKYESLGLEGFDKFVARQLAISNMPIELAVALGIYYARSKDLKKQIEIKESFAEPYDILFRAKKGTIEKVIEELKGLRLVKDDIDISYRENEYTIYYSLNKDEVEKRYSYLTIDPDADGLKKEITFFNNISGKDKAREAILEGCCSSLDKGNKEFRYEKISRLLDDYPALPEYYLDEMRSTLDLLHKNLEEIRKGYAHIFEVQKKIAGFSEEKQYKLQTIIKVGYDRTSSELYVNEELKDKIRPMIDGEHVWHHGLDFYVQHMPQFLERIYLMQPTNVGKS